MVQAQSICEMGTRTPRLSVRMVQSVAPAPRPALPGETILWAEMGMAQPLEESSFRVRSPALTPGSAWSSEDPLCHPAPPRFSSTVLTWRPALAGIGPDRNAFCPGTPRSLAWRKSEQRFSLKQPLPPPNPRAPPVFPQRFCELWLQPQVLSLRRPLGTSQEEPGSTWVVFVFPAV